MLTVLRRSVFIEALKLMDPGSVISGPPRVLVSLRLWGLNELLRSILQLLLNSKFVERLKVPRLYVCAQFPASKKSSSRSCRQLWKVVSRTE
jgi:hypothetical protein